MTSLINITAENSRNYLEHIFEIELLSFPSHWSLNAFQQEIKKPISHLWGLTVNDVISGYICFWMFDSEIQLINLAVHPKMRGKHLGYYLLAKMIKTGISKGMQYIWLEVRISNMAAIRLYEKLGFQEVGRRSRYYRDTNEDAIVMSLTLSEKESYRMASN